jgi:hypothetical protein
MLFEENTPISAFIKDTDKIWEGIIVTRSDNIKVVLNEETGRWKRLSDLDNIKILTEDFASLPSGSGMPSIDTVENKKIKYNDIKKNFVSDIVGDDPKKAVQNAESVLSNKSAISAGGQALFQKAQSADDKDLAPKNQDEATDQFNTEVQNIAGQAAAAQTGNPEDGMEEVKQLAGIKEQLHPSLRKYFETEFDEEGVCGDFEQLEYESDDGGWEVYRGDKYLGWVKNKGDIPDEKNDHPPEEESDMTYEDENYLDIPDDVKKDIMDDIQDLLRKKEIDIEDRIKSNYELSDRDAEEFVAQGMKDFLATNDVEVKDSIKDEVEKSFEDTIDNFKGKPNDLICHLADVYEIGEDEAEKIVEKTQGKVSEIVFEFVKVVKSRLRA